MAKVAGLQRSGKGWAYRKRVPDRLRGVNGLTQEIKIPLGRCGYDEACRLARFAAVEADAKLAAAERVLNDRPATLDDAGIGAMVLSHFHAREKEAMAERELAALDDPALESIALTTTRILAEHVPARFAARYDPPHLAVPVLPHRSYVGSAIGLNCSYASDDRLREKFIDFFG